MTIAKDGSILFMNFDAPDPDKEIFKLSFLNQFVREDKVAFLRNVYFRHVENDPVLQGIFSTMYRDDAPCGRRKKDVWKPGRSAREWSFHPEGVGGIN